MKDKEIIDLYFARSESALSETLVKHGDSCRRIARAILEDEGIAEECVMAVVRMLWNQIPPREPQNLSLYLNRLTRKTALNRWKTAGEDARSGGAVQTSQRELGECGAENSREPGQKALILFLNRFLEALPEGKRQIFLCRYWYFDSLESTAQQAACSREKAERVLQILREKLHRQMGQEGIRADGLELLEALGAVRGKYILQAGVPASKNRKPSAWMLAALALVIGGLCFLGIHRQQKEPDILEIWEAILSGEETFLDMDRGGQTNVSGFCQSITQDSDWELAVTQYTLADLDGDGPPELILWETVNGTDDMGFLVIRYEEDLGPVGYGLTYRQMVDLKVDGTFGYSGGVANSGYARLSFSDSGWEYVFLGGVKEDETGVVFFWADQTIPEWDYREKEQSQCAKKNSQWLPYPQEDYHLTYTAP